MNMSLFVLLLLSGLLCSASGLLREYQYINRNMTWTDAQSYCRERYTDLATVDSMGDVNRIINLVNATDGYRGSVWIGLQKAAQNRWVWSNGEDTISQYSPWGTGEPFGRGDCVSNSNNAWYDCGCEYFLRFACYNESTGYVRIDNATPWTKAQRYCRRYHTDLATVHNFQEQQQLHAVVGKWFSFWIGLFKDSWQWSDQWNLTFKNWAAGQPLESYGDCVAMLVADSGKWVRDSCDQQYHFICYGEAKLVKRQTVRLRLSNDGRYNLNDPLLQTAIMNEINKKLKSLGLTNARINWRKDEDGEVFHLSKRRVTANPNTTCDRHP
ncbi:macrophage mannose receptor 1-like [Misgurnus anguillicaudatus]|uniref:macrophage mannose receptor 1-like n=1 Tax=Misgurnus anguillicaudatus TaxID=75329 RepID=UPI003CCF28D9